MAKGVKAQGGIIGSVEIDYQGTVFSRFVCIEKTSASVGFESACFIRKDDKQSISGLRRIEFLFHAANREAKYARANILFERTDHRGDQKFPGFPECFKFSQDLPVRIGGKGFDTVKFPDGGMLIITQADAVPRAPLD
ncbi:hypothetical protein ES708_21347 [subsurface metagenome]